MKRWTEKKKKYDSGFLRKLQAYENIGTVEEFAEFKKLYEKNKVPVYMRFNAVYSTTEEGKETLNKLLRENNLSFRKLSVLTGIDRKLISEMFKGKGAQIEKWKKIAKELSTELEVLRR